MHSRRTIAILNDFSCLLLLFYLLPLPLPLFHTHAHLLTLACLERQVVANAIHVLMALQGEMGMQMLLSHSIVIGLLHRLKEFNEWSQCLILHVILHPDPKP